MKEIIEKSEQAYYFEKIQQKTVKSTTKNQRFFVQAAANIKIFRRNIKNINCFISFFKGKIIEVWYQKICKVFCGQIEKLNDRIFEIQKNSDTELK